MTQISVALPVYNGGDYIREALDSILGQTFTDFELVVSDNCSSDETPAILAEYAARDSRVRVNRSNTFLSQVDNVNRSVELCSTPWVKLFCHDDIMQPNCLEALHQALSHPRIDSVGLIGHAESWLFANGYVHSPFEARADVQVYDGQAYLRNSFTGGAENGLPALTTAMVRKTAWAEAGRFDGRFAHFDVFLWTRLLMRRGYLFVPQVLTTNRIHGAQVAVSARKSLKSVHDYRLFYREFVQEFGDQLGLSRRTRAKISLKSVGVASTTIAIALLKGEWFNALRLLLVMPPLWWLLLPPLTYRSYKNEKRRLSRLEGDVPLALIYPS